jgi:hypothetical protein
MFGVWKDMACEICPISSEEEEPLQVVILV